MSSRYDVAVVRTLKRCVSPTLTLISVAKPWIAELPDPDTSQVPAGAPGLLFSQATGLTSGAHGSAAAAAATGTDRPAATSARARAGHHRWIRDVDIRTASPPPRKRTALR